MARKTAYIRYLDGKKPHREMVEIDEVEPIGEGLGEAIFDLINGGFEDLVKGLYALKNLEESEEE